MKAVQGLPLIDVVEDLRRKLAVTLKTRGICCKWSDGLRDRRDRKCNYKGPRRRARRIAIAVARAVPAETISRAGISIAELRTCTYTLSRQEQQRRPTQAPA